MATDEPTPTEVNASDLEELSRRTLKALLEAVGKPDVRASTLAVATKFLSEHRIPQSTSEAISRAAREKTAAAELKNIGTPFTSDDGEDDRKIDFSRAH